ncbi:MAG: 3-oxoacyl-[acyl-carrier-protein] reductase [Ignavibacteriae bacterium]|nr:3-oxoacyl-[acyl-carrier-protein] reductase [Ignavibacteriota bacterium]
MNLENKIAVVTGGAKGIGLAISEKLAEVGATVYALGRSANIELDTKYNIIYKQCDVSDLESVTNTLTEIHKESGKIDILVNNAGITKDNLILRMSESDFDDVMNINLKGVFNTCKTVSKFMLSQKQGRIINIGSIVGTTGNAGQSNYAASKAGLIGFTKSLAKELAGRNILVNLIAPGYVLTEMTGKLTEDQVNAFKDNIPLKRAAEPSDIADVVAFFASTDSRYITGQVLHVDGGLAI